MDQRTDLAGPDPIDAGGEPSPFINDEPSGADNLGSVSPPANDAVRAQEVQVEQTRAQMSETIDAIQQKLSPENLAQQAKETVRDATIGKVEDALNTASDKVQQVATTAEDSAAGVGSTIIETIKRNPVPAALAGIGLGWLVMSARNSGSQSPRSYRGYPGYGNPYAPTGYGMQGSSSGGPGGMVDQVQSTASQMANQVQDSASQMVDQVQGSAGQIINQTQQGVQQAAGSFEQMTQQNPLGMGVVALGLGAAVGLAIPETGKEDQLMGPARETVMQQVQQATQDTMHKVETVAEQTTQAAKESANKEGLT